MEQEWDARFEHMRHVMQEVEPRLRALQEQAMSLMQSPEMLLMQARLEEQMRQFLNGSNSGPDPPNLY